MTDPQTRLFGWCQSHGRPDQYHNLCRRTFTSEVGVVWTCSCIHHLEDEQEGSAD